MRADHETFPAEAAVVVPHPRASSGRNAFAPLAIVGRHFGVGVVLFGLFNRLPTARPGLGSVWLWANAQMMRFVAAAGAGICVGVLTWTGVQVGGQRVRGSSMVLEWLWLAAVIAAAGLLGTFRGSR